MKPSTAINICRPGNGASCALCCGSHNYDVPPEELGALFLRRRRLLHYYSREYLAKMMTSARSGLTGSYRLDQGRYFYAPPQKIETGGIQCLFTGFREDGSVGCLVHPHAGSPGMRVDCHLAYGGKTFHCAPAQELSDEEILYAAKFTGDPLYYGPLIHSPEILRDLMEKFPDPDLVPEQERAMIRERLWQEVRGPRLHLLQGYFG
jgi:hypothetical protein